MVKNSIKNQFQVDTGLQLSPITKFNPIKNVIMLEITGFKGQILDGYSQNQTPLSNFITVCVLSEPW